MNRSVVIVGAGVAGLSVGCYLQMNGYDTRIVEQHDQPGGLCTAWRREGYVFDNCVQWLVGSGPGNSLHRAWRELGAVQDRQFVDHEEFTRVVAADGATVIFYTDIDRLEGHLRGLAPEDAGHIATLTALVRRHTRLDLPLGKPVALQSTLERARAAVGMMGTLPAAWSFLRYGRTSVAEFAAGFHNPLLRTAFSELFDLPDFPLFALTTTLAWMHNRTAGYPIGGSLEFVRGIERRYHDLGGHIDYGAAVSEILVEDRPSPGREDAAHAVGVRLADGSVRRADHVVSAADGHATVHRMLGGRFLPAGTPAVYDDPERVFPPLVRVSLGIARDLSDQPHALTQVLAEPLTVGGVEQRSVGIRHYCYDPTLAPPGSSAVGVFLHADYDHWHALADDPARYAAEKQRVAATAIELVDQAYPGTRDHIDVVDVATPVTFERYTGNWRGSPEGILLTTENLAAPMSKTLPGLAGFYQVGHWVAPGGGLPSGAMTGREVAQLICACDGVSFAVTEPGDDTVATRSSVARGSG